MIKIFNLIVILIHFSDCSANEHKDKPPDIYEPFWNPGSTSVDLNNAIRNMTVSIMDLSADPCEDFYQFACGNFEEISKEYMYKGYLFLPTILLSLEMVQIKKLLSEESSIQDYSEAEKMAQIFYRSCINEDYLKANGIQQIKKFLQSLDGWPFIESQSDDEPFNWLNLTAHLSGYGQNILFSLNMNTTITYDLNLIIGTLFLDNTSYYTKNNSIYDYRVKKVFDIMIKSLVELLDVNILNMDKLINDVFEFEKKLALIKPNEKNIVELEILEIIETIPGIDWRKYFGIIFKGISDLKRFKVDDVQYFKDLSDLISKTPTNIIGKYVFFRLAYNLIIEVYKDFLHPLHNYIIGVSGEIESRSDYCYNRTITGMGSAVAAIFSRNYFTEETRDDTLKYFFSIKESFEVFINASELLDEETKIFAKRKLDLIRPEIGYQPETISHLILNQEYENYSLSFEKDEYLNNSLHLHTFFLRNNLWRVGEYTELLEIDMNAYIDFRNRKIRFLTAFLQPPIYHKSFPKWANYGKLGNLIGHEMGHAFDIKNFIFDLKRRTRSKELLTNDFVIQFLLNAGCIVHQYNNFEVPELDLNSDGLKTVKDDMADYFGITVSYLAYADWLDRNRNNLESENISGLNLTPSQLFFVSFSQTYCDASNEDKIRKLFESDHSYNKFRAIGPIYNSPDFVDIFNCPIGSKMNLGKKCSIL